MGEALVSRGLATAEDVAADYAALSAQLGEPATAQPARQPEAGAQSVTTQAGATLSPGTTDLTAEVMAPPDTPAGYKFDPVPAGVTFDIQQQAAFRAVCYEAGIAAPIAAQVDRLFSQAVLNPPTPEQIEVTRQQTHLQLTRTFGDQAGEVIEVAQREFAAMVAKQPWLKEAAQVSGLAHNYYAIVSLWNTARARGRA
jgi:hypothetical protein